MDLNKLAPAPWLWISGCYWTLADANNELLLWSQEDEEDGVHGTKETQEFITLARNAFDIMMRRGWFVKRYAVTSKWFVICDPCSLKTIVAMEKTGYVHYHADPFTALIETEKWYVANIEAKPITWVCTPVA